MADSRTTPVHVPGRLGGRYVLRGEIGRGGMATVHRARDEVLHRDVAVKLLHAHLAGDETFLDRFRREARAAAALSHPNVVTVHDWGETPDGAFLVLRYVEGSSLREVLRRRGRLTAREALGVLGPAAAGLGAAHAAGLVHRDVKPENLLLDIAGAVHVTDFGLARAAASATSTFGADVLVGSPHYLSPEAVGAEPLGPAADVYGLGVVLFECLTGRPPHEGDSPLATAVAHTARRVPAPSSLVEGVAAGVDEVVRRATAPRAADRHPDGAAFAEALAAAVPDGPVPVHPGGGDVVEPTGGRARGDTLVDELDEQAPTLVTGPPAATTGEVDEPDDADDAGPPPPPGVADDGGWAPADPAAPQDAEDAEEPPPPRRRRAVIVLLLVLGLLAASAAGGYLLWDRVLAPVTPIPAVAGASEQAAAEQLSEAGFDVEVADETPYSLEVAEGHVLEQDPVGEARQGTVVTLTLSGGPRPVEVPAVDGEPSSDAVSRLEDAGLEVSVAEEQHHEEVAEGHVISQEPASGAVVDEASSVQLVVSLGPRPIEVPGVVGRLLDEVTEQLEDLGLRLSVAERRHHDDVPEGAVVSQAPDGGVTLTRGDTVEVVVSRGPEPIEVPDVRGEHVDDAVPIMDELGFEVEVERRDGGISALLNPGRVVDQQPGPGATRLPGETVTLFAYEG